MYASSFTYRGSTGNDVVPDGGTVLIPYPEKDASSGRVNQADATVVVGNQEYVPADGEVGLDFDQATATITVTNMTGADWPPQTDVVVVAPGDQQSYNPDDMQNWMQSVDDRLTALEGGTAAGRKR